MTLPDNWLELLEQLRREQNPRRYRDNRPFIQLPTPEPPTEKPEPDNCDDGYVTVIRI